MHTRTLLSASIVLAIALTGCGQPAPPSTRGEFVIVPTVVGAVIQGSYTGPCPPASDRAPAFQAIISVPRGPVTITYQWLTGRGGSADPTPKTLEFPNGGPEHVAISFTETRYLPDQTLTDWIAVYIRSPRPAESNHMSFTTTCHTGRPHRLDPA
jgi:hypothetical protein